MNLIAADVGNSTTKFAIMQNGERRFLTSPHVIADFREISLPLQDSPYRWVICSVNQVHGERLEQWIQESRPQDQFHLIRNADVELESDVVDRDAVGRDRLVAAWMASQIASPNSASVVIDAGTAVTIDFVSVERIFLGGVIFPGLSTQLGYLGSATDALPDLSNFDFSVDQIMATTLGTDTTSAILSGVIHSQLFSMVSITERLTQTTDQPCEIFATGGGIEGLSRYLPKSWNIVPNLVLQGALSIGERTFGLAGP